MITKTMKNRLNTIDNLLVPLEARVESLKKERRKIVAFLEDDAHDANAAEMGLVEQNQEATKSELKGDEPAHPINKAKHKNNAA